ncbi:MAG: hypothetical protein FJ276_21795 [Planctomycetes bacterium]|nr:hypothetical protein [Planctomycetota bacterium]
MKMQIGFTTDMADPLCMAIRRLTGGAFSHCFPMFVHDDGRTEYFESIWKCDPDTGKTGVRGPLPISRLADWHAENPLMHVVETQPISGYLPLTDAEVRAAWDICLVAVPTIHYAKLQIGQNWLEARTGIYITKRSKTQRWTCSEHVARCMPARLAYYFGWPDVDVNRLAPSGTRMVSVETAINRWLAAKT